MVYAYMLYCAVLEVKSKMWMDLTGMSDSDAKIKKSADFLMSADCDKFCCSVNFWNSDDYFTTTFETFEP